ncbi:MAG TPA: hypothetical protein VL738_40050 [Dactylosporangium sp.]|jgi:hypothetical protein|nr:hypothetical protein [Dactylosporangium sp.]
MRWSVAWQTALYGVATGDGVLIAGTHGVGVGGNLAYGPPNPVVYGLLGGIAVAGLVVPVWAVRAFAIRSPREWPQLLVPVALLFLVPAGIAAGGQWQHPWETSACWAVVAVGAHLAVALLTGERVRAWPAVALALLLVLAAAVGAERLAQPRWLGEAVAHAHLPLVVPVAAGYEPVGVGLDDYALVFRMRDAGGRTFDVRIFSDGDRRIAAGADPGGVTTRPATAKELAGLPRIPIAGDEYD